MRILLACDKFKGSLTAEEANNAIAAGIRKSSNQAFEIQSLPIADGGDGLVATLVSALGGRLNTTEVTGPLGGPVKATVGFSADGKTGILEMAEASGIALLKGTPCEPARASTYGTGEMIQYAKSKGCREIILGIGGSATNDGGTGMALALGYRFLNTAGKEITALPEQLAEVSEIIAPEGLQLPAIRVACDVTNPLLGPNGCTNIYGPQKGIKQDEIDLHESRLKHLVSLLGEKGTNAAKTPGAGAAGGLGFGCIAFAGGTLESGFDLVADLLKIESAIRRADLIITGEGSLDQQSLLGKGPGEVARIAKAHQKRVVAFCGVHDGSAPSSLFDKIIEIRDDSLSQRENMARGEAHLIDHAAGFASELQS